MCEVLFISTVLLSVHLQVIATLQADYLWYTMYCVETVDQTFLGAHVSLHTPCREAVSSYLMTWYEHPAWVIQSQVVSTELRCEHTQMSPECLLRSDHSTHTRRWSGKHLAAFLSLCERRCFLGHMCRMAYSADFLSFIMNQTWFYASYCQCTDVFVTAMSTLTCTCWLIFSEKRSNHSS